MTIKKSNIANIKKYGVYSLVLITILTAVLVLSPFIQNIFKVKNDLPFDASTYIQYKENQKYLNDKNILFFKANWCSTCHIAENNILNDLASIPTNLTIYSVDFENSKNIELKKKYNVTTQHTFVQVDKEGNMIKKWELSYTVDEILNQVV